MVKKGLASTELIMYLARFMGSSTRLIRTESTLRLFPVQVSVGEVGQANTIANQGRINRASHEPGVTETSPSTTVRLSRSRRPVMSLSIMCSLNYLNNIFTSFCAITMYILSRA